MESAGGLLQTGCLNLTITTIKAIRSLQKTLSEVDIVKERLRELLVIILTLPAGEVVNT